MEIYFQPLKVCVARINAGLFYFMPVKFSCQQQFSVDLDISTNCKLIDIIIIDSNDDSSKWIMLNCYEAKLLIEEIKRNIIIAENYINNEGGKNG